MHRLDVVIVGGGIGGSALAANLATAGLEVLLLERETSFVDRIRGEWITPWGTAECQRLGIHQVLLDAGANQVQRLIAYDEIVSPADAESATLRYAEALPDLPLPLCVEHVVMQNALLAHAEARGAQVCRGVEDLRVTAGAAPHVSYRQAGESREVAARLVVGADGRTSAVRRQLGLALAEDPIDHLMSGLLVDHADDWPSDLVALGKIGDVSYFVFPQGGGRVRAYVDYDIARRGRYSGAAGARRLLAAFDHPSLPEGRALAAGVPAGPCRAFPSQDASVDTPCVEGAVLIGDAAGYSDPIWGQGLSSTFRDVRIVRDLLLSEPAWNAATLAPYVKERRERSRRLRWETRYATQLYGRFDPDAVAARTRAFGRMAESQDFQGYLVAGMAGPESAPDAVFTQDYFDALFGP
jgi:menaquinone-9 beta-reductase